MQISDFTDETLRRTVAIESDVNRGHKILRLCGSSAVYDRFCRQFDVALWFTHN